MSYGSRHSRNRGWWGYMKYLVRKYGSLKDKKTAGLEKREMDAVRRACEYTLRLRDGRDRMALVEIVFWKRTHNLQGAALKLSVSERTALRWHGDFIKAVAREFFGEDAFYDEKKKQTEEQKNDSQNEA